MQKPIKICYILPEYNKNVDSHFYHLYEFLEEASKKVDLFLIVEKSDSRKIELGSKAYIQRFRFMPLRFLEIFLVILGARFKGYKNFYTHYAYNGAVSAAIICRLFGGRSFYWNCAMNWLFKQRRLAGLGYRLSLSLSTFLVTGGETMKQGYAEHYGLNPEKIKVMPNWINLNRFQPKLRTQGLKPKNLLFVHWLSKRKGADMIVPTIKHLLSDFPLVKENLKLKVIGDGPYKETLIEEIKDNKLEKFMEVLGGISNKNIIQYYQEADIFFMPSMEEGFPRVLLEAMAMGVPYVASDVGSVREISCETAQRFLVKSGDVAMFAHKIEALISDKEIYEKFKKEELEKVKEYSLEKVLNKFINIISESTN
jgi:glycosyltransferase involved in cell wall biosynthesis